MTCECCHCCFCCCEQNYDNNPNDPKKPKTEIPVSQPPPPIEPRTTPLLPPPPPPVITRRSEPVVEWPDELIPGPPTVEEWMERPPIDIIRENDTKEEEEQFSFPPKTPDGPPPVPGCMDPTATNYNPNATVSDGSCVYPPVGIPGCMNSCASNYNPNATIDDGSCTWPTNTTITIPVNVAYTPIYTRPGVANQYSRMLDASKLSNDVASVENQGPDPGWAGTSWSNGWGEWDGVPIDINGKTPSEICSLLFKNGYFMKGLRQRYYQVMPFADPVTPTVAEIDRWNIEVIKHLRALVGKTTPLYPDPRLYIECAISNGRYFNTGWDTAYPGVDGTAYGPCQPGLDGNAHCGASFFPNVTDLAPFLPQYGLATFSRQGQTEGIGPVNTNVPWALKLTQRISNWVCTEGTTGHAGPFFCRTRVGMGFYIAGTYPSNLNASTTLRVKWAG